NPHPRAAVITRAARWTGPSEQDLRPLSDSGETARCQSESCRVTPYSRAQLISVARKTIRKVLHLSRSIAARKSPQFVSAGAPFRSFPQGIVLTAPAMPEKQACA